MSLTRKALIPSATFLEKKFAKVGATVNSTKGGVLLPEQKNKLMEQLINERNSGILKYQR